MKKASFYYFMWFVVFSALTWSLVRVRTLQNEILKQRADCAVSPLFALYLLRDADVPVEGRRASDVLVTASLDQLNTMCLTSRAAVEKSLDSPLMREAVIYWLNITREGVVLSSVPQEGFGQVAITEREFLFKELRTMLVAELSDAREVQEH